MADQRGSTVAAALTVTRSCLDIQQDVGSGDVPAGDAQTFRRLSTGWKTRLPADRYHVRVTVMTSRFALWRSGGSARDQARVGRRLSCDERVDEPGSELVAPLGCNRL